MTRKTVWLIKSQA